MTSMLDQYEQASHLPKSSQSAPKTTLLTSSGYVSMKLEEETPIFMKQKMNFNPSDNITHIAVANDNLVLAMANNALFRINLKNPDKHEEIVLSKYTQNGSKLSNLFIDPLGCHIFLTLSPKSKDFYPELLYLHKKSTKLKPVGKSKSYEITAVGWNYDTSSENTTGAILLGTSKGLILETEIGPDGDKMFQSGIEQYWKQLPNYLPIYGNRDVDGLVFDIGKGSDTPITGIEFRKTGNANKYFVFVTTSERLYQFMGYANYEDKTLLQPIFNTYLNVPEKGYMKKSSTLNYSKLQFFCEKSTMTPMYFGWLIESGIFHGQLNLSAPDKANSMITDSEMIAFPPAEPNASPQKKEHVPLSFVLTEFHAILIYKNNKVKAVSLLNKELVHDEQYSESLGNLIDIVKDPIKHTIWAITSKAVFRYKVSREQRNVWQIYTEKKQFELARKFCENNPAHLDTINVKQAELLFDEGQYEKSAEIFAETQSSFESICLKFLDNDKIDALKIFLRKKLNNLKAQDKIQTTMLVVWIVELYLSQLSHLQHIDPLDTIKYNKLQKDFESFLCLPNVIDCIKRNKPVIYDLMSSHGDKDNLIKLTVINRDFENLIRQHIFKKSYPEALGVLKSQNKRELFYQFAPILLQEVPKPTVTALIEQGKNLNPSKLLAALVSCDIDKPHIKEMIRYLEYCIQNLGCTDQAIHNYLLTLYVEHDEAALMRYLASQGQVASLVNYDIHYALRMCREKELKKACVQLSSTLGLWESAVELALTVDVELAKTIANMLKDSQLKKKLWLKIAEFVINGKQDVQQAMEFLQQCDLIKMEDILPFFSDFVTIDHFREPICNSLQEYNQQIQDLREEMEEATKSAEQVRAEIQSFRNRCTVINVSEVCVLCDITLLLRPFYLFPCGHKFHSDCLTTELQPLLGPAKKNKLASLQKQLNSQFHQFDASDDLFSGKLSSKEQIRNEIDNILASECLYCGEYMIQAIDTPFIPDSDWDRVMKEWE